MPESTGHTLKFIQENKTKTNMFPDIAENKESFPEHMQLSSSWTVQSLRRELFFLPWSEMACQWDSGQPEYQHSWRKKCHCRPCQMRGIGKNESQGH